MSSTVSKSLARRVRKRASFRCEYCLMVQSAYASQVFPIDHIRSVQHGGTSTEDNLASSCLHCNSHKGPNIAGYDPLTNRIVRLFHPRMDRWHDHFRWEGSIIVGRTAIGRTTVSVLSLNDAAIVAVREELMAEGIRFAKQ